MTVIVQGTQPAVGTYVGAIGIINGDVGSYVAATTYPTGTPYSTYSLSGTYIPGQALMTSITGVITADTNFCYNYDYFTPLTATTVVITQSYTVIAPAATIAALTVSFPAAPFPGQIVHVSFNQIVTALTVGVAAPGTATFVGTPLTAAAVGSVLRYIYDVNTNSWFPC